MHFDPNTSTVMIGLMYCFLPIATYIFLKNYNDGASILWCLGGLLNGIGLTLVGLRYMIELPTLLAYNAANTIIFAGILMRLQSLRVDLNKAFKRYVMVIIPIAFSVLYQLDCIYFATDKARVLYVYIIFSITFFLLQQIAGEYERTYKIKIAKAIRYTYALLTLVWTTKITLILIGLDDGQPFGDNLITMLMTLAMFISVIFSNFGYVGMRLEKIDNEKKLTININKQLISTLKNREKVIKDFGRIKAFSAIGGHSATVVHEIMQPLTAMRFGLENLSSYASKEVQNPEVTSRIDSVKETAEKTIKIVQNLRSLMVEQDVQVQAVNLKEQIDESLLILGDRLKSSRIKVITKMSARLSDVMADPNQMQHVLLNIINNAIDAIERESAKNPRKIEINVYPVDKERHMILSITDSGSGISNKIKDHLFEWLSSNSGHGMGVGLALTKLFVESWGGTIEAKNAEPTQAKATDLNGAVISLKLLRAH